MNEKKIIKKHSSCHPSQIHTNGSALPRSHSAWLSSKELVPETFNLCRTKI